MRLESPHAHELRTMPDAFTQTPPQRSAYEPVRRNKPMIDTHVKGYWEMTESEYIEHKRQHEALEDAYLEANGVDCSPRKPIS